MKSQQDIVHQRCNDPGPKFSPLYQSDKPLHKRRYCKHTRTDSDTDIGIM